MRMYKSVVSIIIPIYNTVEALRKCLDSVINQTYREIELILINDGSTDDSGMICREYAARDNRIIYIEQKNLGVSEARNKGIVNASGEYIAFVDSDDSVESGYIECMLNSICKSGSDIVIQGLKSFRDGMIVRTEQFETATFYSCNITESVFDKIFYFCGPYCKLFKSDIIKKYGIKFPVDMSYGEDAVFYYKYLSHCRLIDLICNTSYNYSVANLNSLSSKSLHPSKFWQNQHNRRGAYLKLKSVFGLPLTLSSDEEFCKLAGIGGMLSSIFKSTKEDNLVNEYLQMINDDEVFNIHNIKPVNIKQHLVIKLILMNNKISRTILKILYK